MALQELTWLEDVLCLPRLLLVIISWQQKRKSTAELRMEAYASSSVFEDGYPGAFPVGIRKVQSICIRIWSCIPYTNPSHSTRQLMCTEKQPVAQWGVGSLTQWNNSSTKGLVSSQRLQYPAEGAICADNTGGNPVWEEKSCGTYPLAPHNSFCGCVRNEWVAVVGWVKGLGGGLTWLKLRCCYILSSCWGTSHF